jgi:OmcA/MtrC family decaheme c-type cytochrome
MLRRPKLYTLGFALILALVISGCSGGNSSIEEETTLTAKTYDEKCALCHRSGSIADLADVHASEDSSSLGAQITGVAIDGTGAVTIDFKLFDPDNALIPMAGISASSIRFTLAKLVNTSGSVYNWQSYINTTEVKADGDPGTGANGTFVQATSERATSGSFNDNGDGTYTYVMNVDVDSVTTPLAVTYDNTLTHRVAMQVTGNDANAYFDFVPNGDPITETRNIAVTQTCNECHIKLGMHGGDRIQVQYCDTCHNPGTTDANSGNIVDLKVMIHKIHAGEDGPDVAATGEYAIWGYNDSKNDYSTVAFPQDLRNCTTCHTASSTTADGDNWKDVPSTEACTSCHEAPDAIEYPTFPNLTAMEIENAHEIPAQTASAAFEYNIISVANTDPGDYPSVTFSVTDPTNSDAAYDILADDPFTSSAASLNILIAWETTDYTNTGSGSVPAEPVSIRALASGIATDNGDGTFTVTSTVAIPATAVGSGTVAMEGHPAGDFDGDTTYSDRVPVTGATQAFAITDTSAVSRRSVVDIDNCNKCHKVLSLHGGNRTGNPQLCVICHNPDATDIGVRPSGTTLDGKTEEAIDFKTMIHGIHAGSADEHGIRENALVIYGYNSSIHDFSDTRLPAEADNLKNCTGCHTGTTYALPLADGVLPTTILTGTSLSTPDDDTNITPTAAVCSSCHDALEDKTHMAEEGGLFDFVPYVEEAVSSDNDEIALCAPGPVSAQPSGHSSRTDCCSCHSL